jgi:hypothetical protein
MKARSFNTLPSKKDGFWQIVLFPTISILKGIDPYDPYTAINFEWLFWAFTIIIDENDKTK